MKLSNASRYTVHALAFLAAQKEGKMVTSQQIAEAQKVPEKFLVRLLRPLVAIRVLQSLRGPQGGYRLARSAHDINLLEVMEAVEGPMYGESAITPDGMDGRINKNLDTVCTKITDEIRRQLQKIRISDLVGKGR
jgi:Rrf2 family protein